jgi:uncharacterized protein YciI
MVTRLLAAGLLLYAAIPPSVAMAAEESKPVFDAALAQRLGADEHGMRQYVFVLLKTGPKPVPKGPERDALFKGHFANMERLAAEGKLVMAGPFDGVDGWRGLFILAVKDIAEAKQLASTDPVLASGEMVAEYHVHYGSAALMQINETHKLIQKKGF